MDFNGQGHAEPPVELQFGMRIFLRRIEAYATEIEIGMPIPSAPGIIALGR
jgi:hypothetical protein